MVSLIVQEEVAHVSTGLLWFKRVCLQQGIIDPVPEVSSSC